MKKIHLCWIIPIIAIIFFICGVMYSWNAIADEVNAKMEFRDAINVLECGLSEQAMNMWEYYEIRCPKVYNEIMNGDVSLREEFEKYGIVNDTIEEFPKIKHIITN